MKASRVSSRTVGKTVDYTKMMEGGASATARQSESSSSAAEGEGEGVGQGGGARKPVDTEDQTVPS